MRSRRSAGILSGLGGTRWGLAGLVAGVFFLPLAGAATAQEILLGCTGGGGGGSSLYTVDASTGLATLIGPMGMSRCSGLAARPSTGGLYAVGTAPGTGNNSLFTVNPTTGAATLVGATGVPSFPDRTFDISFRRGDEVLFGVTADDSFNTFVATYSTFTGAATLFSPPPLNGGSTGNGLSFDGSGTLYHADEANLTVVNQSNGQALSSVAHSIPFSSLSAGCPAWSNPPVPGYAARINSMDSDSSGVLFGVLNCGLGQFGPPRGPHYLVTISPTGAVAEAGPFRDGVGADVSVDGIAFLTVTQAPALSPALLAVLAVMLVLAGLWALRRKWTAAGSRPAV